MGLFIVAGPVGVKSVCGFCCSSERMAVLPSWYPPVSSCTSYALWRACQLVPFVLWYAMLVTTRPEDSPDGDDSLLIHAKHPCLY